MSRLQTPAALEQEIAALADMPRAALTSRWQTFYKSIPPKGISRILLIRAVAHAMQVKALRGLKPAVRRRLLAATAAPPHPSTASPPKKPALQPGARLIREWNGKTYTVAVVEDGYIWNGERHRSLSAIARAITGARWSGPRFFGLRAEKAS